MVNLFSYRFYKFNSFYWSCFFLYIHSKLNKHICLKGIIIVITEVQNQCKMFKILSKSRSTDQRWKLLYNLQYVYVLFVSQEVFAHCLVVIMMTENMEKCNKNVLPLSLLPGRVPCTFFGAWQTSIILLLSYDTCN